MSWLGPWHDDSFCPSKPVGGRLAMEEFCHHAELRWKYGYMQDDSERRVIVAVYLVLQKKILERDGKQGKSTTLQCVSSSPVWMR